MSFYLQKKKKKNKKNNNNIKKIKNLMNEIIELRKKLSHEIRFLNKLKIEQNICSL